MSYESTAEPIKLGYLFDFRLPEYFPKERREDLIQTFELVFNKASRRGSSTVPWRSCSVRSKDFRRERSRR